MARWYDISWKEWPDWLKGCVVGAVVFIGLFLINFLYNCYPKKYSDFCHGYSSFTYFIVFGILVGFAYGLIKQRKIKLMYIWLPSLLISVFFSLNAFFDAKPKYGYFTLVYTFLISFIFTFVVFSIYLSIIVYTIYKSKEGWNNYGYTKKGFVFGFILGTTINIILKIIFGALGLVCSKLGNLAFNLCNVYSDYIVRIIMDKIFYHGYFSLFLAWGPAVALLLMGGITGWVYGEIKGEQKIKKYITIIRSKLFLVFFVIICLILLSAGYIITKNILNKEKIKKFQQINYEIKNLDDFELSPFCKEYNCSKRGSSDLRKGLTTNRYWTAPKNGEGKHYLEVYSKDNRIVSMSLSYFKNDYQDKINKDDLEESYLLLKSINSSLDINDSLKDYITSHFDVLFDYADNVEYFEWGHYLIHTGYARGGGFEIEVRTRDANLSG